MFSGLSREDLFIDPDVKQSKALPLGTYWQSDILQHEWYTIFSNTWSPLPKNILNKEEWEFLEISGHGVPFTFYNQIYFFVRSFLPAGKPVLNCFPNNCPHLDYPLLKNAKTNQENILKCDQHGLTTDCDGKLFYHPSFARGSHRAQKHLSLRPIPLRKFQDLLFLTRNTPVASFEEFFGPMLESIAYLPISEFLCLPNPDEERILDGNWKFHALNYMDILHVPHIHKEPGGLQDAVYMDSYKTLLFPYSSLQWVYAKNPEAGFDWRYLPDKFYDPTHPDRKVFALWWFIFPNMTFNFYPWGLSINIYMPIAGDPLHVRFFWYHYVWNPEKYKLRDDLWLISRTDREDISAIQELQRNIQPWGPKFERGTFGDKGDLEIGPHWFQRKWFEMAKI